MTKTERIEAMWLAFQHAPKGKQMEAAYDAADVEGMVRAGCYRAIAAHINRRVGYNEDAMIDDIVRRVCG